MHWSAVLALPQRQYDKHRPHAHEEETARTDGDVDFTLPKWSSMLPLAIACSDLRSSIGTATAYLGSGSTRISREGLTFASTAASKGVLSVVVEGALDACAARRSPWSWPRVLIEVLRVPAPTGTSWHCANKITETNTDVRMHDCCIMFVCCVISRQSDDYCRSEGLFSRSMTVR